MHTTPERRAHRNGPDTESRWLDWSKPLEPHRRRAGAGESAREQKNAHGSALAARGPAQPGRQVLALPRGVQVDSPDLPVGGKHPVELAAALLGQRT